MKLSLDRVRWILLLLTLAAPDAQAQLPAAAAGGRFTPENVKVYTKQEGFFEPTVLRTLFLDFKQSNWHQLLMSYYHSNVDVPANLTVDGKSYPGVGVSYRGNSSFQMVGYDRKHSFSIDIDAADEKQRLYGLRSLKLLNANQDPSFLRTYLYHYIARQYKPAPRVNFVRVVVNGENWGIYVNVEAINSDFTKDQFGSGKGARWKVSNFPRGQGGLVYFGENAASYRSTYELKSQEDPKAWADLIKLCRILNRTPPDQLPAALEPIFDVDGALKFLALDNALQNADGFWTKAGEYSLYEDTQGVFHVIMWDVNESFKEPGGRGGAGMLDPYAGSGEPQKAMLYYLLRVPAYEQKYLGYIRDIAENWMRWEKIGPEIERVQALLKDDIALDHRKLYSTESFLTSAVQDYYNPGVSSPRPPEYSLKGFLADRRAYLLSYPGIARPAVPKAP
jgi:hypothetical protein